MRVAYGFIVIFGPLLVFFAASTIFNMYIRRSDSMLIDLRFYLFVFSPILFPTVWLGISYFVLQNPLSLNVFDDLYPSFFFIVPVTFAVSVLFIMDISKKKAIIFKRITYAYLAALLGILLFGIINVVRRIIE
jgi:hypothetical protein